LVGKIDLTDDFLVGKMEIDDFFGGFSLILVYFLIVDLGCLFDGLLLRFEELLVGCFVGFEVNSTCQQNHKNIPAANRY
jgi:hypothetical protein